MGGGGYPPTAGLAAHLGAPSAGRQVLVKDEVHQAGRGALQGHRRRPHHDRNSLPSFSIYKRRCVCVCVCVEVGGRKGQAAAGRWGPQWMLSAQTGSAIATNMCAKGRARHDSPARTGQSERLVVAAPGRGLRYGGCGTKGAVLRVQYQGCGTRGVRAAIQPPAVQRHDASQRSFTHAACTAQRSAARHGGRTWVHVAHGGVGPQHRGQLKRVHARRQGQQARRRFVQ